MSSLKPTSFSAWETNIFNQTMDHLDSLYDSAAGLLLSRRSGSDMIRHDVRSSCSYAAGLLARGRAGDIKRAWRVISAVLDQQLFFPEEIYHATFKRAPEEPNPPVGNYPWRQISPESRHMIDVCMEKTTNSLLVSLEDHELHDNMPQLETMLNASVRKHFPEVWRTYDPNWREFISSTFAIILDRYEKLLPPEILSRLDSAMYEAVKASIDRRIAGLYPMNTNIELMHIFIADYFGHRLNDDGFVAHAQRYAADFYRRYAEFHSVAEWNSPTYYSVDLGVLAQWRLLGKSNIVRELGTLLEIGLWEDVSQIYNPALQNLCGPYTRNHEMDMRRHTSFPIFFYLNFGPDIFKLPYLNDESPHNIAAVLYPTKIPEHVKALLLEYDGEKSPTAYFRELIERGAPSNNNPLCTATSWISRDLMIGGLSGSRNVSGQLHPATAHWRAPDGAVFSMRLLRREIGQNFGKGNRSVFYNASVSRNKMEIKIDIDIERDIEVFFQFAGNSFVAEQITADKWNLPGLTVHVTALAPKPAVAVTQTGMEIAYLYKHNTREYSSMEFTLRFEMQQD